MDRYFFVGENLKELEQLESELESRGITTAQIHVLSNDEAGVAQHSLHEVSSLMRTDVIRKGLWGALVGFLLAIGVLGLAYGSGLSESFGWMPFVFLAVVIQGFCTWEAGFFGFQVPNTRFRRFDNLLKSGKHLFFVDLRPEQAQVLDNVLSHHRRISAAGQGVAIPWCLISLQNRFRRFVQVAP